MAAEEIEYEVLVDAPAEIVWEVLTEPDHLAWFGNATADVDLRPGGTIVFFWPQHGHFLALVTEVDHPRRFGYRWALVPDAAPAPGNSTLVEFTLTPTDQGTRLRVVESGFAALAGSDAERATTLATNQQAWTAGFAALSARAGKLASQRRR